MAWLQQFEESLIRESSYFKDCPRDERGWRTSDGDSSVNNQSKPPAERYARKGEFQLKGKVSKSETRALGEIVAHAKKWLDTKKAMHAKLAKAGMSHELFDNELSRAQKDFDELNRQLVSERRGKKRG